MSINLLIWCMFKWNTGGDLHSRCYKHWIWYTLHTIRSWVAEHLRFWTFSLSFEWLMISRWKVSSIIGLFLLYEWQETAFIQKSWIIRHFELFTWNTRDLNSMGCARTHIFLVFSATNSKQDCFFLGKLNI